MKLNRKKFFKTAVLSLVGISIFKRLPFSDFGNNRKTSSSKISKIKVKINPSAVSRNFKEGRNA
jgi:hypothetical protein